MADTNVDYQNQLDRANKLNDQLNQMFEANKAKYTTAEEQTANLNKQSQAAYQEQKIANQEAQNQFAQNQSANQLSALDAIRRSNASAIANGANAGLSAANQLSSILGLQEETSEEATNIANQAIESAAAYNTQLNENAIKGQEAANQLNATLDANAAELAKSLATNAETIAKMISDERNRQSQEAIAGLQKTTNEQGNETTTTTAQEQLKLQQEADKKAALLQQRDSLTSSLSNLTNNFQGGDAHTYVTSYYDPFENRIITTGNEKMQKRQTDDIINKLNAKIKEAYDSGNETDIKLWTDRANQFMNNLKYKDDACLVPGTLITLADGTTKPVEYVKAGDDLLVWDMLKGKIDTSPVLFVEHDKEEPKEVIKLTFSDATEVEFIYEHGFYDINLGRYVYLHNKEEATKLIGHKFFKYVNNKKYKVKLVQVTSDNRVTTTHSPCTVRHLCLFANGILTMPGATSAFTNIFKVNKFKCKYSKFDVCRKIKKYGIFIPEDFAELLPKEIFYAFQGEFLKINIAQGKTSMDEIKKLISRYAQYLK